MRQYIVLPRYASPAFAPHWHSSARGRSSPLAAGVGLCHLGRLSRRHERARPVDLVRRDPHLRRSVQGIPDDLYRRPTPLKGATYTVNWQRLCRRPADSSRRRRVARSILASWPRRRPIFAQAAGDPVKVVAVTVERQTQSVSLMTSSCPPARPSRNVAQLRGQTVAVQEGTVEQYVLIQALKKAGIPYSAVNRREPLGH